MTSSNKNSSNKNRTSSNKKEVVARSEQGARQVASSCAHPRVLRAEQVEVLEQPFTGAVELITRRARDHAQQSGKSLLDPVADQQQVGRRELPVEIVRRLVGQLDRGR